MTITRRSLLRAAGVIGGAGSLGFAMPGIGRAATPIKITLPWLPLGTYSYVFVAKELGFFANHGLDVTIDRGFGSGKVWVPFARGRNDLGLPDPGVRITW